MPSEIPQAYTEESTKGQPVEKWWEAFNDPRLNEIIAQAFENNLDLRQAYANYRQLQAVTKGTRAIQYPSLNAEYENTWEETPGFFGDNEGNSYRLAATAAFEVDLWQKLNSRTRAAQFDMKASQEEVLALYLSLSARLADFYYLAIEQRAQIALTDNAIASFEDTVERVERRYREGLVPALDVYQARQNLAAARAKRPVFEANLAVAEHAVSVLLGYYPERDNTGDIVELPSTIESFPAGLPSELLSRRPDVQAAKHRLEASDARIAVAIADYFPSINLIGSYGESSTVFSSGDITGTFWKVILDIAQPLFDGGKRNAEMARSKAEFEGNLAIYHESVLTAFKEVEDALANNKGTEKRIKWLEKQIEATEASLRLSLERYMQGISDYLPVLTAQVFHFNAKSDLLAARRQLISDRISLAKALGGNWMSDEFNSSYGKDIGKGEES
jgi:NodT family efflux transporter outer membrane factor (OMF) lipoprotein